MAPAVGSRAASVSGYDSKCYGVLSMGAISFALICIADKLIDNKETISTFLSNNAPDIMYPNTSLVIGACISIGAVALASMLYYLHNVKMHIDVPGI